MSSTGALEFAPTYDEDDADRFSGSAEQIRVELIERERAAIAALRLLVEPLLTGRHDIGGAKQATVRQIGWATVTPSINSQGTTITVTMRATAVLTVDGGRTVSIQVTA